MLTLDQASSLKHVADKTCAVYRLINIVTNDIYIGSTNNLRMRFAECKSKLRKGQHHSSRVQQHYKEHGEESFRVNTIEEFDPPLSGSGLKAREEYWKRKENPTYNTISAKTEFAFYDPNTGFRLGKKNKTEFNSKDQRNRYAACRGNTLLDGYYWRVSSSGKLPLRISTNPRSGKNKPIEVAQLDLNGNEIGRYNSIGEAASKTGCYHDGIRLCIKGWLETSGGYRWKRIW